MRPDEFQAREDETLIGLPEAILPWGSVHKGVIMAGGSRDPGRTVTSKVLAILEAFEKFRGAMSLTDIAEQSGLPLSTTHRLVNELTDWGFLTREPNGRYQLGIRLWELAQNTGRQLRGRPSLHPGPVLADRGDRAPAGWGMRW